jgi:hypothetical protein
MANRHCKALSVHFSVDYPIRAPRAEQAANVKRMRDANPDDCGKHHWACDCDACQEREAQDLESLEE